MEQKTFIKSPEVLIVCTRCEINYYEKPLA